MALNNSAGRDSAIKNSMRGSGVGAGIFLPPQPVRCVGNGRKILQRDVKQDFESWRNAEALQMISPMIQTVGSIYGRLLNT
jgi:hypothetical protein